MFYIVVILVIFVSVFIAPIPVCKWLVIDAKIGYREFVAAFIPVVYNFMAIKIFRYHRLAICSIKRLLLYQRKPVLIIVSFKFCYGNAISIIAQFTGKG